MGAGDSKLVGSISITAAAREDSARQEIEITPEMLEAGLSTYWQFSPDFDESPRLVKAVFLAMLSASPSVSCDQVSE
jgi:hypothetical protein